MAYGNFKDLNRKTFAEKVLRDKAKIRIAKDPEYHGYQRGLRSMVFKFFDKKTSGKFIKNKNVSDKELANELHKPIIRKFKKRKVHSAFMDNRWGASLVDMQLITKFNKRFRFLLCVIDIYSKYFWVFLSKIKQCYNHQCFSKNFKWIKPQTK